MNKSSLTFISRNRSLSYQNNLTDTKIKKRLKEKNISIESYYDDEKTKKKEKLMKNSWLKEKLVSKFKNLINQRICKNYIINCFEKWKNTKQIDQKQHLITEKRSIKNKKIVINLFKEIPHRPYINLKKSNLIEMLKLIFY